MEVITNSIHFDDNSKFNILSELRKYFMDQNYS